VSISITSQVVFDGAVTGLIYGFLAIGLILVYRASGIVNFAYGAIGSLAAVLVAKMALDWNWPLVPAVAVGVAASALTSAAIEMTVVRRLAKASRVTLFVATIGAAQVVMVMVINVPSVEGLSRPFPAALSGSWQVGGITIQGAQLVALVVTPVLALGLAWFLKRSLWGIAITAMASNEDATRLAGLSTRRVSTLVWLLAGGLTGLTAVLAAPLRSTPVEGLAQGSGVQLLVIALAVALLARMSSLTMAVAAGVLVGIVERVVFYNWAGKPGLMDLLLFGVVLVGVLVAHGASGGREAGGWSLSARVAPLPDRLRSRFLLRRLSWGPALVGLVVAVAVPLAIDTNARYFLFSRMALIAVVVISVTILTGWAGQLSLAQFALAGLGAMTMAGADAQLNLQFLPALGLAVAVCVVAAVAMGLPSFRVRGMYLAIVTLAFANAAYAWFFYQGIFTDGRASARYQPSHLRIGSLDLSSRRTYYLVCLAVLVVVVLMVNRIRRSGVGRALIAVRNNESAAAAYGVQPRRVKLFAFALAGGMSGLAGGLLMALTTNAQPDLFPVDMSLSVVAMAVIGGLASVAGAILGTLWVVGLPTAFGQNNTVTLLTSGVGLLVLVMYVPGGLMQLAYSGRDLIVRVVERRQGDTAPEAPGAAATAPSPVVITARRTTSREQGRSDAADLSVRGLTIDYGPTRVVAGLDLEVRRDEVVGLIGANGAGKTTIMNAIGGFIPASGRVELLGRDVSNLSAAHRARRGLGRGFQDATLFGDLTVLETVALAHELIVHTQPMRVLTGLPSWRRRDRGQLARARELVDYLGLGPFADQFVSSLSTGTRRICELACLLALEPRVICLDEPTAGVAQRETEAFGPLITRIQAELGASLLVIEHDMPFVMAISHRMYCLEAGAIIAEGPPEQVRHDPRVIASYLGTDLRAIERSGTAPTPTLLANAGHPTGQEAARP
jgi:ABC-type branched-subunit amino acid transport system ATPase component/ABC-type branched-subunit amino acid transport system permease subunit